MASPPEPGDVADPPSAGTSITRDVVGFTVVSTVFGLSFGMAAHLAGLPWIQTTVFSATAFAGASQFATVGIVATGGSAAAILVTSALLNARFMPLSIAVANRIRTSGWWRVPAIVVMTDPSALFALKAPTTELARRWYWAGGVTTWLGWTLGSMTGAIAADRLRFDPATLGLDVALPALLFGLSASALKQVLPTAFLVGGGVVAILALPYTAAGAEYLVVGVVAAVAALVAVRRPVRFGGHES